MIGSRASPLAVSSYSTRGGDSAKLCRSTIPSSSRARRRSERVRGLIPAHECSSSEKRRGPSDKSWTRRAVHLAPMISAHAATEQLWSGPAPSVRFPNKFFLSGLAAVRNGLEPVADAVAGLDERVVWRDAVDLVAEAPDEDVDGPIAVRLASPPDPLQELIARGHPA